MLAEKFVPCPPMDFAPVRHVSREPQAFVIVQITGSNQFRHPGIHAGQTRLRPWYIFRHLEIPTRLVFWRLEIFQNVSALLFEHQIKEFVPGQLLQKLVAFAPERVLTNVIGNFED
jgi:hypothetical protein